MGLRLKHNRHYYSAEQGVPDAQNNMGCFYFKGIGVDKDLEEAAKWFAKGAKGGDTNAQANLGFCYMTGQGVAYNPSLAIKWWKKAADQGHQGAIRNLEIAKNQGDL